MTTVSIATSNTIGAGLAFDHVLAYELGQADAPLRRSVERMLREGNPEYIIAQESVLEVLGAIPSILPPVAPPAFVKERVMSHAAQDAGVHSEQAATEASHIGRTVSTLKRSVVFSGLMLIGGMFIGGFALNQIIHIAGSGNPQATSSIRETSNPGMNQLQPSVPLTQVQPVEAPNAEVASSEAQESAARHRDAQTSKPFESGHLQTNFALTQAYLALKSNPAALQYSLEPASRSYTGAGRILWDDSHEDALLVVSKLQATATDSHYVLWYTREGMPAQRMMTFSAGSAAPMSFFVNHAPSDHVTGVEITLEKNSGGRSQSQEILHASVKERVHP